MFLVHQNFKGMISCLAFGLFFPAICMGSPPNPLTLPIEVLGEAGTNRTLTLTLPSDAPTYAALTLRLHNLEYPGEVALRINNRPFLNLDNTTAPPDPLAASWGGIGGPIATQTLRIPLPPAALAPGANTLTFRFNRSDGNCNGFRVLSLNLVRTDGSLVLPPAAFVEEDPAQWQPPLPDAASIAQGKTLWQSAPLRSSSLSTAYAMQAHCGDCHAQDGRDLKYFNFSNASIEARSVYHGLSAWQGEQIASYIRSLPFAAPGRPWNPPYQPGVGLDSVGRGGWSGGGGLESVLSSDAEMLPYLFAEGVTAGSVSPRSHLNLRELPIALPLPDWNQWLPRVHPLDTWGTRFSSHPFSQDYFRLYASLSQQQAAGTLDSYLSTPSNPLGRALYEWEAVDKRAFDVEYVNSITQWNPTLAEAVHSTMRWHLVKEWELMHEFDLEEKSVLINGDGPLTEPRSWYSNTAFGTSPKAQDIPEGPHGLGGNARFQHYFADAWYQLQLLLNPGNGHRGANYPVDWPYLYGGLYNTALLTKQPTALRWTALLVKGSQEAANGIAPGPLDRGWNPSRVAALFLWGHFLPSYVWHGAQPGVGVAIVNEYAKGWLTQCEQFTPQQYYAAGAADPSEVADPTRNMLGPKTRLVDQTYWMMPVLRGQGVAGATLDAICEWAKTLWPHNDWDALKTKAGPGGH